MHFAQRESNIVELSIKILLTTIDTPKACAHAFKKYWKELCMKKIGLLLLSLFTLFGCTEIDDSTLITDDYGYVHRTIHYLKDKRGREYYP